MKTVSLSGSPRENVGKKDAAALRDQGLTPCVIYGGDKQVHFSLKELDLNKIIFSPDVFLAEISVEGEGEYKGIIREIQFHPVTDRILHVDFLQVMEGKEVKMDLPVHLSGNAIGVRNGGRPSFPNKKLAVKGVPLDFPDAIEVDIEKIRIGMKIRVGDLQIPGLNILAPDDMVIFAVKTARGALDEEEEEEEGEEGAEGEEGEGGEGGEGAPAAEAPAEG
ncbi:MAG: 50S ribosomal protein L25 [Flavobacteriales bacterium]|nr:50S ribosomal protein L25 [Flavobacteriales bacterium]